ncbi:hypothetical protein Prudu_015259 [Prunus dulcis]|uniref:Uncharacterized protein n=1 Tax=Prunus dulcis TaxID=3755 RepID=A0A4Y1RIL5_PRUDU|nr:hypothetical protein Prudu_015259 [Prunus dulcis]
MRMASLPHGNPTSCSLVCERGPISFVGISALPSIQLRDRAFDGLFAGVDPLQAGNVVQLVLVLGLTIGWISTYIFRVSNKEMTYAQQIRL